MGTTKSNETYMYIVFTLVTGILDDEFPKIWTVLSKNLRDILSTKQPQRLFGRQYITANWQANTAL